MSRLFANKSFYLCILIALLIGIAIGLPYELKSISLKFEIDFMGVCEIITTIILAIYITNSLEKRVQDNRIEKELYISRIRMLEDFVSELRDSLNKTPILYSNVNSIISRCRIKKNNILNAVSKQFNIGEDKTYKKISIEINKSVNTLRSLMTSTDVGKKNDVSMANNILSYSPKRLALIHKELDNCEDQFFKLVIYINSL